MARDSKGISIVIMDPVTGEARGVEAVGVGSGSAPLGGFFQALCGIEWFIKGKYLLSPWRRWTSYHPDMLIQRLSDFADVPQISSIYKRRKLILIPVPKSGF